MEQISSTACFGGAQNVYSHDSSVLGCEGMKFSVFLPPQAEQGKIPALLYLSGLTCTHENVMTKGMYQRLCSQLGLAFIAPDTSPRGEHVANDEGYDLGQGAGFYLSATEEPWSEHYRMDSYLLDELLPLIGAQLNVDVSRLGLSGHSMGGHGALTLALKNPDRFQSLSAFSPIVAPCQVPWGHKAFTAYLGPDQSSWADYDATQLLAAGRKFDGEILIDQGEADGFLDQQLQTWRFTDEAAKQGQAANVRMQPGYGHSYFFIASFMEDHLRHHARGLGLAAE